MKIADRQIGPGHPVYLIAEAGSNHNGYLSHALRLIQAAADAGADAVKFQRFTADNMVAPDHPDYLTFKRYAIPDFWLKPMKDEADECGIHLFYSVFCPDDVATLEKLADPPAYKIASAELTYTDLLTAVAATGKPMILSTGMSTRADYDRCVDALYDGGLRTLSNVIFLHCVAAYPAPPADMNLSCLSPYGWGLSDHTADPYAAPLMAAGLGASIVEKHFTMSRQQEGPDHSFAIEPHELKALATSLHQAHLMLGDGVKRVMPSEQAALSDRRVLINGKWLRGYLK